MEQEHSDLDRWWNRKWNTAIVCTSFAAILVAISMLFAIFGTESVADKTYRVMSFATPTFLVPLIAYFGVSEWHNQTKMKL